MEYPYPWGKLHISCTEKKSLINLKNELEDPVKRNNLFNLLLEKPAINWSSCYIQNGKGSRSNKTFLRIPESNIKALYNKYFKDDTEWENKLQSKLPSAALSYKNIDEKHIQEYNDYLKKISSNINVFFTLVKRTESDSIRTLSFYRVYPERPNELSLMTVYKYRI